MNKQLLFLLMALPVAFLCKAQSTDSVIQLNADRVFDGEQMHNNWIVAVKNNQIVYAGEPGGFSNKQPVKIKK